MDEIESKTSKKLNLLKLGDIYKTLNDSINNLQNDINLLNYLEISITSDKQQNNISQTQIQTIVFKLQKLKMESTNLQKHFEDLSLNYNIINRNKNNLIGKDELIIKAIKTLNEKYKKILLKIKSFIIKSPVLIDLREDYLKTQLDNLSYQNNKKKGINKTLSISNFKNKNVNIFGNYKNNLISNRNISINDFINSNAKKIKIDILKNKIKSIQINFDGSQLDTNDKNSCVYDKSSISPSNIYDNLTFKSFAKNEINTKIINNLNTSTSREKLLFIPKTQSFIKNTNHKIQKIATNQSQYKNQTFHINKSCNNSSINLSVINHKHKKKKIINNVNKVIPNNYRRKPQINSLENTKNNANSNSNTQNCRHKGKNIIKNNKSFNFAIKSILFDTKLNKRLQYKKIKPNILIKEKIKDKEKEKIFSGTTTPAYQVCQGPGINKSNNNIKTNNININNILYTKPIQNEKRRSNSEYLLNSIKNDIKYSKSNNNSLKNHNKKLRGFSLDNLSWNKLEIQHLETNVAKRKRPLIRNRAINVLYDNSLNGASTAPNRNFSYNNVGNQNNSNNMNNYKIGYENAKNIDNDNIIINYETFMNTREENKKLKTEVISLKKEIERLKYMYQDLSFKVSNLEEQNEKLRKENHSIKFCNIYQK